MTFHDKKARGDAIKRQSDSSPVDSNVLGRTLLTRSVQYNAATALYSPVVYEKQVVTGGQVDQ